MTVGRSDDEFRELCVEYALEQHARLGPDDDPPPMLLLDTDEARAAGGVHTRPLGPSFDADGFDRTFYVTMPVAIMGQRAARWALLNAWWVAIDEAPADADADQSEHAASARFARGKLLEGEGVLPPPSERPDRFETVSVVIGTPDGETDVTWRVEREPGLAPPHWKRADESAQAFAGRFVEPARQAARMVAEDDVDLDDPVGTFWRYVDRVLDNVADAHRVFRRR